MKLPEMDMSTPTTISMMPAFMDESVSTNPMMASRIPRPTIPRLAMATMSKIRRSLTVLDV